MTNFKPKVGVPLRQPTRESKEPNNPRDARQKAFLAAFAELGVIKPACVAAKISREALNLWRREDREFEEKFMQARQDFADSIVGEAVRRARDGVEEDVYNKDGELVGTRRRYSDRLMLAMLAKVDPEGFRTNTRVEHAGVVGHITASFGDISHILADPVAADAAATLAERLANVPLQITSGGAAPAWQPPPVYVDAESVTEVEVE